MHRHEDAGSRLLVLPFILPSSPRSKLPSTVSLPSMCLECDSSPRMKSFDRSCTTASRLRADAGEGGMSMGKSEKDWSAISAGMGPYTSTYDQRR